MVKEIQRINPVGLYDPSPNGNSHVTIAPPGASIVYIAGQGGEDENNNPLVVDHDESKLQQLTAEVKAIWGNHLLSQTLIPVPRLALDGMLFEVDAVAMIST